MKGKRLRKNLQSHICSQFNKKGFTLVEAIVSIALIAILSIVVYSLFFSMARISKYSEEQVKRYTIIRVIKENVAHSVRTGANIHGTAKKADANKLENLPVTDLSDQEYPEYTFDLEYLGKAENNTDLYKVTLKYGNVTSNSFEFQFEVYKP
ncbi:MAG: type II secretion system protein [Clostridiaceae bacterium]|nr:type II secretion system protein [Clostridiaceae bacterium]